MKKIRCLLADDEPLAIALIQKHIAQLEFLEETATCSNSMKALEILKSSNIDLLFLDIQMPGINGMELLRTLRHPPKVIVTTAYREYAVDSYDLDIVDYLLKPITFERFFKAIERYLRTLDTAIAPVNSVVPGEASSICVKSGYKNIKLYTDDILYIESLKDYVKIVTTGETVNAKYRISDLENELAPKGFIRIHRSYIVNLRQVSAFTASDVKVGKTELPIGDSYKGLAAKRLRG